MSTVDTWQDCYRDGWKGIITEASFAHPAKVSYSLAERIYHHLADEGWIAPGRRVLDPFGGIGGFALHALLRGYHFVGVELEEKFVLLAQENICRWARQYCSWPRLGSAVMMQGDSRRLRDVLAGQCDAVVSSPPYAASLSSTHSGIDWEKNTHSQGRKSGPHTPGKAGMPNHYSDRTDNLGNSSGSTFWSASRAIVEQCYDLLSAGGHCVWVLKAFVRRGAIVDFPGQWRTLCESVGFVTVHEHRAMLVEETAHDTLFNGTETRKKERKSFFRRLHEKKNPATAIDYETVYCLEKP
jgi:modification methylase